jgi:hypothetical protein
MATITAVSSSPQHVTSGERMTIRLRYLTLKAPRAVLGLAAAQGAGAAMVPRRCATLGIKNESMPEA